MRTPAFTKSARFRLTDRQTVDSRSRRYEVILDWHGFPGCAKLRQQFRSFQSRVRVPGQTVEMAARVEPAFQGGPLPSFGRIESRIAVRPE
jgi:hypothetical protein